MISHDPFCVSKRIECFQDQWLKMHDNYNPVFSMENTYKTVMIYVSTFKILNSFSNKQNKLSLTKAFQTIKPARPPLYQQLPYFT